MLKVIVELHPYGDSSRKAVIHEMFIGNVGMSLNDPNLCDYHMWWNDPRNLPIRGKPDVLIRGHRRTDGALELLRRILANMKRRGKLPDYGA